MTDTSNTADQMTGDAAAVISAALAAAEPHALDPAGPPQTFVLPASASTHTIDPERYAYAPRRKRGRPTLATVASLVAYVKEHKAAGTTLWVDPTTGVVEAVLDDHAPDGPGWGDHRATLRMQFTDEWTHWAKRDGVMGTQQDFATHIEDGLTEITRPDGADMLELAQSFHATTKASFRSAQRLVDGTVQVQYDEEQTAKAGKAGDMSIPAEFLLSIAPYIGEDPRTLTARLRYRVNAGSLTLGYQLVRPNTVVRDVLDSVADRLRGEFEDVYIGTPR